MADFGDFEPFPATNPWVAIPVLPYFPADDQVPSIPPDVDGFLSTLEFGPSQEDLGVSVVKSILALNSVPIETSLLVRNFLLSLIFSLILLLFQDLTDSVVNDVSPDVPASSSSWLSGSIWAHDGPILFPWLVFDPN
jgi:hypothetical protein